MSTISTSDANVHLPERCFKASIEIYYSDNYSLFHLINGNRDLDESKIKRIKNDILSGLDLTRYCPIIVKYNEDTKKLDVIDGQHRFYVCMQMKKKVYFVMMDKEIGLYAIARMNSNTEKWKPQDFVKCYAVTGNENYIILQQIIDEYKISVSTAYKLLHQGSMTAGGPNANISFIFQRGDFKVNFLDKTRGTLDLCKKFSDGFKYWYDRPFIQAIQKIMEFEKCDFDILIKKFKSKPELLQRQATYKDYCTTLENIYNFRNEKRQPIY